MFNEGQDEQREANPARPARPGGPRRWVCHCSIPPFLLATIEEGKVNLKIRDRYYHIEGVHGRIRAICPRCGKEHIVELHPDNRSTT